MPKKRKILICTTIPLSVNAFYGEQLKFLQENGYEVSVLTSPEREFATNLPEGVHYYQIMMTRKITPWQDFKAFCKIFSILKKEKFDIIQYNTPKASILCSAASWLARTPIRIYFMWGLYYSGKSGLAKFFYKFFERRVCAFSTNIAPDSIENCEFALQEGLTHQKKIKVVGIGSANGINIDRFDPQKFLSKRIEIRKEYGIEEGNFVLGTIARLGVDKGINELVLAYKQALEKIPHLKLILVGPMEEPVTLSSEVLEIIESTPSIILTGFQKEVENFLCIMDIFVLASYREGFGVANLEASSMKLPVITTDIRGPREAIVDGETGVLVQVKNVESLKNGILSLASDQNKMKKLGENGRKRVIEYFEQKRHWQNILDYKNEIFEQNK